MKKLFIFASLACSLVAQTTYSEVYNTEAITQANNWIAQSKEHYVIMDEHHVMFLVEIYHNPNVIADKTIVFKHLNKGVEANVELPFDNWITLERSHPIEVSDQSINKQSVMFVCPYALTIKNPYAYFESYLIGGVIYGPIICPTHKKTKNCPDPDFNYNNDHSCANHTPTHSVPDNCSTFWLLGTCVIALISRKFILSCT